MSFYGIYIKSSNSLGWYILFSISNKLWTYYNNCYWFFWLLYSEYGHVVGTLKYVNPLDNEWKCKMFFSYQKIT